eukprot:TRINITY_DN7286_c0_g1_i1.p2 TRINITY_DN7286_c0_g1~~TRINITY_DN7286_c0_g1_i1.p2  ORF type:complete len:122 (-),score=47.67 TRINITY_DN7286_c0_g1_i1:28-393(-)
MVDDIAGIAKGTAAANAVTPAQELAIKTLGLECLVTIMKSMVDWTKELVQPGVEEIETVDNSMEGHVEEKRKEEDLDDGGITPKTMRSALEGLEGFEKKKKLKEQLDVAIAKFNRDEKEGR